MPNVVCQKWEESERGWGNRPDGYSLHLTEADRVAFVEAYWNGMPDSPPDEYSRPDGTPYAVDVDDATFAELEAKKDQHGVRFNGGPPGSQGTDGWRSR